MEEKQHKAVHRLQLTDRREGSITGVKDVQSFDEKEISLVTEAGRRASCNQTGFGKAGGRYRRKGRQLALQPGNNKSKGRRRRLKEAVSVAYERVYVSGASLFLPYFSGRRVSGCVL